MSSIENCQAVGGSITAEGNAAWGFGALCGAPWGAPEIKNCTVNGTVIRVTGEGNRLVGGLLGFGFAQIVSVNVFGSDIRFNLWMVPITVVVSMAVAALSCLLPVRRAVAIDPALVLKGE